MCCVWHQTNQARQAKLSLIERRGADAVLTAQIRRLHSGLLLLQDRDDLLFPETTLLRYVPSPSISYERTPVMNG